MNAEGPIVKAETNKRYSFIAQVLSFQRTRFVEVFLVPEKTKLSTVFCYD